MPMPIELTHLTRTTVRKDVEIRLDRDMLLEMLNAHLFAQGGETLAPDNAEVFFPVPGGADWSNTDLDIDERHPVVVRWSTTEES